VRFRSGDLGGGKLLNKLHSLFIRLRDYMVERRLAGMTEEQRFSLIYKAGYWKGKVDGSLSGEGSSLEATANIRRELPGCIGRNNICTMLDVPCGDWYWMSRVEMPSVHYIGGDIVEGLVRENQRRHGSPGREFRKVDLIADRLPCVDLIFVRDCFVHLETEQITTCLRNIVKSGSTYLATTTFTDVLENGPPVVKDRWRALNMLLPPFSFPPPLEMLDDRFASNPADRNKYMGVWRISDLAALFGDAQEVANGEQGAFVQSGAVT